MRAWAWRNVLRAAYPSQKISFLPLAAAYLAGAGINAVVPAHAGDVTKVFLVKRQIPDSSYPAVTSSFLVQTIFDTSVGVLVFLYALSQGLLPRPPEIPACRRSRSRSGPTTRGVLFTITVWAWLPDLVRGLPRPPGAQVLGPRQAGRGDPDRADAVSARGRRLAGGRLAVSLRRLLVLSRGVPDRRLDRQRRAGDERPGDRQRSSPSRRAGPAPSRRCSSRPSRGPRGRPSSPYSVGTQVAMAAWAVILGFAAILLVFRTTDWKGLIPKVRRGRGKRGRGAATPVVRNGRSRPSSTSPGLRPLTCGSQRGIRRRENRSGCGRAGSRAGPGRGPAWRGASVPAAASTSAWVALRSQLLPAERGAVGVGDLGRAERDAVVWIRREGGGAPPPTRSGGGRRRRRSSHCDSGGRPGRGGGLGRGAASARERARVRRAQRPAVSGTRGSARAPLRGRRRTCGRSRRRGSGRRRSRPPRRRRSRRPAATRPAPPADLLDARRSLLSCTLPRSMHPDAKRLRHRAWRAQCAGPRP